MLFIHEFIVHNHRYSIHSIFCLENPRLPGVRCLLAQYSVTGYPATFYGEQVHAPKEKKKIRILNKLYICIVELEFSFKVTGGIYR